MPHIQAMIDTQRIMCLRKYTKIMLALGSKCSIFVKDYGSKFLLHCNFSVADLPSCLPNERIFRSLVQSIQKTHFCPLNKP